MEKIYLELIGEKEDVDRYSFLGPIISTEPLYKKRILRKLGPIFLTVRALKSIGCLVIDEEAGKMVIHITDSDFNIICIVESEAHVTDSIEDLVSAMKLRGGGAADPFIAFLREHEFISPEFADYLE